MADKRARAGSRTKQAVVAHTLHGLRPVLRLNSEPQAQRGETEGDEDVWNDAATLENLTELVSLAPDADEVLTPHYPGDPQTLGSIPTTKFSVSCYSDSHLAIAYVSFSSPEASLLRETQPGPHGFA